MIMRKQLQGKLWKIAHSNESIIRQKTKIKWLKEGDCNSRYYHLLVNWKQRHNMLRGVAGRGGGWA